MRPRSVQRAYNVRYYAANREREIARVTSRQAATTAFLRELRNVPCADCGGQFLPMQMDFDHRDPSTKSFNLTGGRAALKSRVQLLAEAAKCDIVCANCHLRRTMASHRQRLARRILSEARRTMYHRNRWRHHADVLDQIRSVPCADCGGRFAPCSMQFDHRDPTTKVKAVMAMISNFGLDRILAEVAKCDIVCANCHRLRTFQRRSKPTA
jgi:hypothetical protein